jgi:predicted DNA-binding transcriptional regulator AlpA
LSFIINDLAIDSAPQGRMMTAETLAGFRIIQFHARMARPSPSPAKVRLGRELAHAGFVLPMSEVPGYISRSTLAGRLDCAESTVDELVKRGRLPKPIPFSKGVVRWDWAEVVAAIKSLRTDANPASASDPYLAGVANVVINNKSKAESRDVP